MRIRFVDRIESGDALSKPREAPEEIPRYSEWHHFNFNDDASGLYGIFNLALSGDLRDPERGRAGASLVVCERGRRWHGTMNVYEVDEARCAPGSVDLAIGPCSVRYRDGRYAVQGVLKDRSLALEATWTPRAAALRVDDIGGLVSTFILPSLAVEGTLAFEGRTVALAGATGYHDHNWGYWSWGRDLGWDWGYVLEPPRDGEAPLAIVFGQVTDATREAARSDLVLMVWRGERCVHVFLDEAVEIATAGELCGVDIPRMPGLVALLDPGRPVVPRLVQIRAGEGEDRLELSFEVESALQFLIPRPAGDGRTTISELLGRYTVRGVLEGRPVDFTYLGFAELAG